jgi:erythromycin esterase
MKSYNEDKPLEEKLRFFGMDCSNFDINCNRLMDDLRTYNDPLTNSLIERFDACDLITVYEGYSRETRIEIIEKHQTINQELIDNEAGYVALMGDYEYELLKQQFVNLLNGIYILEAEYGENIFLTREEALIANSLWVNELVGPDGKVAVWAHNVHVAKDPSFESGFSLGHGIEKEIGDQYANIATTFTRGNFNAFNPEFGVIEFSLVTTPATNSLNFILSHAKYDNFILKVEDIESQAIWEDFFSEKRSILQIGSTYDNQPGKYYFDSDLTSEYDYFINIDLTTASLLLD